jgi:tetratricopeptide (TPR) repeat protein
MMHLRLAAAALAALLALACAGQGSGAMPDLPGAPPRKPSGEIRRDPNADQALAQLDATARGQPKQKQVEIYLNFRKAYPATTAGEEALYRAGVLSFELGDYVNARKQFNELLFENPLFPQAQDARFKLGLSALELKAYRDAYQTLLPLRDRIPGEQRAQLEDALRRSAEGARLYDQAMKMALQKAEQASTPEERSAALAHIGELVDAQVGSDEVARVQADLSPSHRRGRSSPSSSRACTSTPATCRGSGPRCSRCSRTRQGAPTPPRHRRCWPAPTGWARCAGGRWACCSPSPASTRPSARR